MKPMLRWTGVLLAAWLAQGCGREGLLEEAGGYGRLILGESVDGARLGDDTLAVRAALGTPTRVVRSHGTLRYYYEQGAHAGIEVYYDHSPGGPVSQRSAFVITPPYVGRTEDGLGIGSQRPAVLEALGEPAASQPVSGGRHDRYVSPDGNPILLIYRGETLDSINMAGEVE